tara:strand:- start:38 stop:856 length:819 start_codon:yes stop_codon:yes gene_type:complete
MPFASRGGFLSQPAAAAGNTRRVGAASTNASQTWASGTGPKTDTSIKKFGTASTNFSVNTYEIYATGGADFMSYGTDDFCIEWWHYIDSLSGHSASSDMCSLNKSGGMGWRFARGYNASGLGAGTNAKWINMFARGMADLEAWDITTGTSGAPWAAGQWYFCVWQRKSGATAFWLDGVLKSVGHTNSGGSGTRNFSVQTATTPVNLGTADGGNGAGPIHIDEMCWSNTWRYADQSSDLDAIPSAPFTVDEYTTQLLHMDGSNGGTSWTNATS